MRRVSVALTDDVIQRVDRLNQSLEGLNHWRDRRKVSRDERLGLLIDRALKLAEEELAERLRREGKGA